MLTCNYPIDTLDGTRLFAAGSKITDSAIRQLIDQAPPPTESRLLFQHETVRDDLYSFLAKEPYSQIFASSSKSEHILAVLAEVSLPTPILDYLDYFKQNDFYTYRHVLIVYALSTLLAYDLNEDYRSLILGGPTHDFGKICIPLEVLAKETPLTLSERRLLQHHAQAGFVLINYYFGDTANIAARVALEHHERMSGGGYPQDIALRDPLVQAVVVSDVYDALISQRPYRQASYDNRTALEEIIVLAKEGCVDWPLVHALVANNREAKPLYDECVLSLDRRGKAPKGNVYGVLVPEDHDPRSPHD